MQQHNSILIGRAYFKIVNRRKFDDIKLLPSVHVYIKQAGFHEIVVYCVYVYNYEAPIHGTWKIWKSCMACTVGRDQWLIMNYVPFYACFTTHLKVHILSMYTFQRLFEMEMAHITSAQRKSQFVWKFWFRSSEFQTSSFTRLCHSIVNVIAVIFIFTKWQFMVFCETIIISQSK